MRVRLSQAFLEELERKSVSAAPFLRRSQVYRLVKARYKAGDQQAASIANELRDDMKALTALEVGGARALGLAAPCSGASVCVWACVQVKYIEKCGRRR